MSRIKFQKIIINIDDNTLRTLKKNIYNSHINNYFNGDLDVSVFKSETTEKALTVLGFDIVASDGKYNLTLNNPEIKNEENYVTNVLNGIREYVDSTTLIRFTSGNSYNYLGKKKAAW
jgi:hypothetical protein